MAYSNVILCSTSGEYPTFIYKRSEDIDSEFTATYTPLSYTDSVNFLLCYDFDVSRNLPDKFIAFTVYTIFVWKIILSLFTFIYLKSRDNYKSTCGVFL